MKVSELKQIVEVKIGTTLDNDWFIGSLNDAYSEIQDEIRKLDPNSFIESESFTIETLSLSDEFPYALPENCLTIERIEYCDELAISPIPIPQTNFDERTTLYHLRWFRMGDNLVFRGSNDGEKEAKLYYGRKNIILNFNPEENIDDEFNLPDPSHNSYLKFYIIGDYYDDENLETDGSKFMLKFKEKKEIILRSIKPVNEPSKLRLKIENGID